jgi:hypothetical protein
MLRCLVITLTLLLTTCGLKKTDANVSATNTQPEKYVSLMCQTGDITLVLNPHNTFTLTMLYWNSQTKKHVGQDDVKGTWQKNNQNLILTTDDNNHIKYALTNVKMQIGNDTVTASTYAFKSNDKAFCATGFDLVNQTQADKFLLKAAGNYTASPHN